MKACERLRDTAYWLCHSPWQYAVESRRARKASPYRHLSIAEMTSAEFVALVGNMGLDRCQLIRYYLTGTRAWRRCRPPNTCLPMATRSWIESSCRGITLQAHEHNGDVVYRVSDPQWRYRVGSTRAPRILRRRAARAIESEGSECVALNDNTGLYEVELRGYHAEELQEP